jgi:hypothetical protein
MSTLRLPGPKLHGLTSVFNVMPFLEYPFAKLEKKTGRTLFKGKPGPKKDK